jgi:hypothetical protein
VLSSLSWPTLNLLSVTSIAATATVLLLAYNVAYGLSCLKIQTRERLLVYGSVT